MPEQTLGEALREVYSVVNDALGVQDASVTFRTRTVTDNPTFGLPDTSSTNSDIVISVGLKISRVKAREVAPGAKIMDNDLKIEVPASLLAEAQLKNSEIIYNNQTYTLIQYAPMEIYSGIPVRWSAIGRLKE